MARPQNSMSVTFSDDAMKSIEAYAKEHGVPKTRAVKLAVDNFFSLGTSIDGSDAFKAHIMMQQKEILSHLQQIKGNQVESIAKEQLRGNVIMNIDKRLEDIRKTVSLQLFYLGRLILVPVIAIMKKTKMKDTDPEYMSAAGVVKEKIKNMFSVMQDHGQSYGEINKFINESLNSMPDPKNEDK